MKFLLTLLSILACFSRTINPERQTDVRYLFFLHNRFIESHGPMDQHPSYGRAEYKEILERFRKDGFIVISEKRPENTDANVYAGKVTGQVDSLLKAGVDPSHITIAGTSKGGYIAQYVSSLARNTKLNFAFIGASFKDDPDDINKLTLYGRILSITEESDTGRVNLSTQLRFKRSPLTNFQEITLHTGLRHGFLFKAVDVWVVPTERWGRFEAIRN
jgi:hypothetical protein